MCDLLVVWGTIILWLSREWLHHFSITSQTVVLGSSPVKFACTLHAVKKYELRLERIGLGFTSCQTRCPFDTCGDVPCRDNAHWRIVGCS